jgi:magnesium transporter
MESSMMEKQDNQQSWEELSKLVETPDGEEIATFLDALPAGETARALSRLSEEDQSHILTTLSPEVAADVVEQISEVQAVGLIEQLEPEAAAAIIHELPSDEQADLLSDLATEDAEAILATMESDQAAAIRTLSQYASDVAGGLMGTEFLAYPHSATVAEVIDDLRDQADAYRDYDVQYAYVCDQANRLVGVLRLRDLLLAYGQEVLDEVMIAEPLTVSDTATLDDLRDMFASHHFLGVPVVDADGVLLGVVRRAAVDTALAVRSDNAYRQTQGIVGGDELRTMPLWRRSRRRLAWLSVNIVLNVIAASVIMWYQDTLAAVIALAVFLPIISDMSGCSGNQAVAVSIRELALGLVSPKEMRRVWLKEVSLGMLNGLVLGMLIAMVAWLWQGNPFLGLVVGAAMALNTLVAVSIGGTVPLLLRRFNLDPALASGPILTTITDMCGFFLILSFATILLSRLQG